MIIIIIIIIIIYIYKIKIIGIFAILLFETDIRS